MSIRPLKIDSMFYLHPLVGHFVSIDLISGHSRFFNFYSDTTDNKDFLVKGRKGFYFLFWSIMLLLSGRENEPKDKCAWPY